jgi:septal ring factor EnvC (AmiA/AmiB activator)
MKKEKNAKKVWQEAYYQDLFMQFRQLVEKHNEILGNKISHLDSEIAIKKNELKTLKAEIKRHEAHLELKESKKHGKAL